MTDEIREQVDRYLAGEVDVDDLETSLPDGWQLDQSRDGDARRVVLRIMGALAEFRNGDLTESHLKDRLRGLFPSARTHWIDQAQRTVQYGSSVSTAWTGERDAVFVSHDTTEVLCKRVRLGFGGLPNVVGHGAMISRQPCGKTDASFASRSARPS
jgi:hypothetical protein